MSKAENLGIIACGGPAPGINGVISAATIEAANQGKKVIGIKDGFKWLSHGKTDKIKNLTIENTSRIHLQGGSIIGISRDNPLASPKTLKSTLDSLKKLKIKYLISIGGDGTLYLASQIEKEAKGSIKVVHVPKTIDNNLMLPDDNPTFGFATARHLGTEIVNYLMEDAKTTSRWFVVVTMGRKTGHLAIGIAKSSGATLAIIPEEFKKKKISLDHISKIIEGSIIKRINMGRNYGVAIIAEGIIEKLYESDLRESPLVKRDSMGRLKLSQFHVGQLIKKSLDKKLENKGIDLIIVDKRIGYELRSAPPIPYDLEYTRDLGYSAVKYLFGGSSGALIALSKGRMIPIKFNKLLDKKTNSTRVRIVRTNTESFEVAQKYMIKLKKEDLVKKKMVKDLSKIANMREKDFVSYFKDVV